jgi:hypothetical protein
MRLLHAGLCMLVNLALKTCMYAAAAESTNLLGSRILILYFTTAVLLHA